MKIEIHLNLLEFRNSISNYIYEENLENGWVKIRGIEGEYFYKEFTGYGVLVSNDFPLEKGEVFEKIKVNKLREILDQPGRVKYYMTFEISDGKMMTTEEDCLDDFPGLDIVNGLIKDFKYEKEECCVKIVTQLPSIDYLNEALNNIINALQLYYNIIQMQEEVAINLAKKFTEKRR